MYGSAGIYILITSGIRDPAQLSHIVLFHIEIASDFWFLTFYFIELFIFIYFYALLEYLSIHLYIYYFNYHYIT